MNKKQIIDALQAAGIEVDTGLTVDALKALAAEKGVELKPAEKPAAGLVTVKVISGQPLCEDGVHYVKGDTFETTPERAKALAGIVEEAK